MNVLLSIGCDAYSSLGNLNGAIRDATEVYNTLSHEGNRYDTIRSKLLISPTTIELRHALNGCYPENSALDVFTFYFAGHGAARAGSFYLCTRESEGDRLSTTAFPITELFTIINEFQPRQVNIIVDACQAGASSFDLNQLQKVETIGSSSASSVTFLGACSANEYAQESAKGGLMTREFLKCLRGEIEIQINSPLLDLLGISSAVCSQFQHSPFDQRPLFWGLNLFGNGSLATNPHFDEGKVERRFPVGMVQPNSKIGLKIKELSAELWSAYRDAGTSFDPRAFLTTLERILVDAKDDTESAIAFLQGVQRTISEKASQSQDSLMGSQALLTCALPLLKLPDSPGADAMAMDTLKVLLAHNAHSWKSVLDQITTDPFTLVDGAASTAELYYFPLRISKILGFLGLEVIAETLVPKLVDGNDSTRFDLVRKILECYEKSIVAVSDAQAPFLYVFFCACLLKKETDLATRVLNLYFSSFVEKDGNIARSQTDGKAAFCYISSLGPEEFKEKRWRPANPSSLLATMLLFGAKLAQEPVWDLRALDHKTSLFFIPSDYLNFADKVIGGGTNHTHCIGFGVWKLREFEQQFNRAMDETFSVQTLQLSPEKLLLCTTSALLFPDRLPLFLERMPAITSH